MLPPLIFFEFRLNSRRTPAAMPASPPFRHADGRWLQMPLLFLLLSIAAAAVSSPILSQPSAAAFSAETFYAAFDY
jgi:hypothetical protein